MTLPSVAIEALFFMAMGLFGAVLYVLVQAENWEDFFKFDSLRHVILGVFIGFFYNLLYSTYSFPNSIMCIVAGYSGTDFILWVMELLRKAWEGMRSNE